ncbi:uncharacterized protein B0I36DRAFT_85664 [Microdochium trichocladiopsis]|uniref:F-box domain-containing protein n=1 Tax=Microdochium trichocladiopsis TaxID=1682393 RepID=A0A9P8YD86_9PEZI|nr:uncharacterized protein B0I36DRAFT_85664 [Microdochium trichocladiopsis]KAH7034923.1 hypothetical protein B0I36DRAFT_85664 [Microdochium trichocladiopsis]
MSATQDVIATPELLEAILLHLDLRTLLVNAQLVNTYFRQLITSSIRLQKALFLLPDDSSRDSPARHSAPSPIINSLLRESFGLWFPPHDSAPSGYDAASGRRLRPHERIDSIAVHHGITSFHQLGIWADQASRSAVMQPEASWRRMFVQQPPPTKLGWLSWGLDFSPAEAAVVPIVMKGVVTFPDGLTMGALYDITQDRIEGFPRDHVSYAFRIVRPPPKEQGDMGEEPRPWGVLRDMELGQHRDEVAHSAIHELSADLLFEERGYYPTRVLGRSLEDIARSDEYRHPAHQTIAIRLERSRQALAVE